MKSIKRHLFACVVALCLVAGGFLQASVAHAGALSDYMENKAVDWLLRGQSFTPPTTQGVALGTNTCSDSGSPAEPSGNAYTRQSITAGLSAWAGTQSAGSTSASSGTSGTTSINAALTWSASTGPWNTLQSVWLMDSTTTGAGNVLFCINLTSSLNVSGSGFTVSLPAGALTFQIDN